MTSKIRAALRPSSSVALLWMALAPLVANSHHSDARYGYSEEITELEGELVSVAWSNPHVGFTIKAADAAGQEALWQLEVPGSLYSHERRGIVRELFQPGDRIRVAGHVAGRVEHHFQATNILLANGREVVIRERVGRRWNTELFSKEQVSDEVLRQRAQTENRGIFRVWSEPFEGDDDNVGELPFRQEAIAARADWDAQDNFVTRCETPGMPDLMDSPYPIEFLDHGSWIELRAIGNYHLVPRKIHMEGASNPAEQAPSPAGYSAGRWEGNTLVVETTRIDWPYYDNRGTPQSKDIKIVESFALSEDQSRLAYRMIVTDLEVFTRPEVVTKRDTYGALGEAVPEMTGCR